MKLTVVGEFSSLANAHVTITYFLEKMIPSTTSQLIMSQFKVTFFQFDTDGDRFASTTNSKNFSSLEDAYAFAVARANDVGGVEYQLRPDGKIIQYYDGIEDEDDDGECPLLPSDVEHRSWADLGTWTGLFARDDLMTPDERWAKLMIDATPDIFILTYTPLELIRQKILNPAFSGQKLVIWAFSANDGVMPSMCFLQKI